MRRERAPHTQRPLQRGIPWSARTFGRLKHIARTRCQPEHESGAARHARAPHARRLGSRISVRARRGASQRGRTRGRARDDLVHGKMHAEAGPGGVPDPSCSRRRATASVCRRDVLLSRRFGQTGARRVPLAVWVSWRAQGAVSVRREAAGGALPEPWGESWSGSTVGLRTRDARGGRRRMYSPSSDAHAADTRVPE